MGTNPFVAANLSSGTHTKVPKNVAGSALSEPSAKLPKGADAAAAIEPSAKLPDGAEASLPKSRMSVAERLRRLEEAMAFLRQHLAAGPQPARKLLNVAKASGIAVRTLHRAKDLLGVTTERSVALAHMGSGSGFHLHRQETL